MADSSNRQWRIPIGPAHTTAELDPASAPESGTVFVCAHGAGGHMHDRAMLSLSAAFCARGLNVVRFNFLYREKRSSRPDPMPSLVTCFELVIATVRERVQPKRVIIGGRSMGGRAASMLAARGFPCDGVLLLAYPLHPPGQPAKLRVDHLASISVPVLCFNGTRDAFCDPDLMEKAVRPLAPGWTMHWLNGADHSFHVLKRSGTTDEAILEDVGDTTQKWVAGLRANLNRPDAS